MSGFAGLQTGFSIGGANGVGVPCEQIVEPCTLYTPETEGRYTHLITVTEPRQFKAFGLAAGEAFSLIMVYGDQQEPVHVGGQRVQLTIDNNYFLLAAPGKYRFEFSSDGGDVWLFCEPVPCCNGDIVSRSKMMGGGIVL